MRPTEWEVDETTTVRLVTDENGRDEIRIVQGATCVTLTTTGATAEGLVQAIICAASSAGWDVPDLTSQGYDFTADGQ